MTTSATNTIGIGPTFFVMAAVTFALMRPPGAARSRKLKPCSAMYVVRVAATAVNFANLISDAVDDAGRRRDQKHQDKAEEDDAERLPVVDEEAADHDEETDERSNGQVDAAHHQRHGLPKRDEAERRGRDHERADVERVQIAGVSWTGCTPRDRAMTTARISAGA